MERPGIVWLYSISMIIGIFILAINSFNLVSDPIIRRIIPQTVLIAQFILLLSVIPQIVFAVKFFMLKRNSLIWLYILFGVNVIVEIISKYYILALVIALIGWAFWDYISHKTINGQPVFT